MRAKPLRTLLVMGITALSGCSSTSVSSSEPAARGVNFGAVQILGQTNRNPSTPFLRYAPDGRLFAVWTQDHDTSGQQATASPMHHSMPVHRGPGPLRDALIAWSQDHGKSWSTPQRVNSHIEAVQGEENGPKIAFDRTSKAFVVWSIPGSKGDRTRANVRFAMADASGGFTPARTLNDAQDAARFPIIEATPAGDFLVAWIDRRIDNPKPRRLYLMKIDSRGQALTKNYPAGEGLCECCKLGISFADGGKTVYIVDREVDANTVRNHVLRKSTDGGATFSAPVEISNDGWQVPSCPHSGPSIGRDKRGRLHVSWFTQGRSEEEAGIYYSVSKDGGKSFAPRTMIHANTAPETLYNNLVVGDDDAVYFAWSNIDSNNRAQIYMRKLAADGRTWSPIQQVSSAKGNASRPTLAFSNSGLHIAWTETDGESSRVVMRTAEVNP